MVKDLTGKSDQRIEKLHKHKQPDVQLLFFLKPLAQPIYRISLGFTLTPGDRAQNRKLINHIAYVLNLGALSLFCIR